MALGPIRTEDHDLEIVGEQSAKWLLPPRKAAVVEAMDKVLTVVTETKVQWGRESKAKWQNSVLSLALVVLVPAVVLLNWIALEQYGGSLPSTLKAATLHGPVRFILHNLPKASMRAAMGYAVWLLFQAVLYAVLPGKTCSGQQTPGGNLLTYTTNGLAAWILTHILFAAACVAGVLDPAIMARNWEGLLVAANVYGFALTAAMQLKGYWFPSYPADRKVTGSWIFDFWSGVELNPRIGKNWDFKFFHNGRPGIVAWTLIDLSWAAYQYQTLGYVTDSMIIVTILQAIYVIDFFCNEDWYLRTIDINHEHFGFYLCWGDTTFLPTFYTLQAQYLARYPTHLSRGEAAAVFGIGVLAYAMFRSVNYQRDHVRAKRGDAVIWGRPAEFIRCKYQTADGKEHNSLLVTSGWWGLARHTNYTADLIQSFAWCATCGISTPLPWSYLLFMGILLYHRILRDERRCRNKYGEKWEEYCQVVPYRLIPGVF